MNNRMDKSPEELKHDLAMQLETLKKESEEWLKVGAAVAVGALVVYGVFKIAGKKKDTTTDKAIEVLEKEGLLNADLKKRLTKTEKSSFWPSLTQRLLILGLALGKEKLFKEMFSSPTEVKEIEEGN
jgi:hypothetical protein